MCPSARRPRSVREHSSLPLGTSTQGTLPTFEPGGVARHRATLGCLPRTSRSGYSPSSAAQRDCPPGPEMVTIAGSVLLVWDTVLQRSIHPCNGLSENGEKPHFSSLPLTRVHFCSQNWVSLRTWKMLEGAILQIGFSSCLPDKAAYSRSCDSLLTK